MSPRRSQTLILPINGYPMEGTGGEGHTVDGVILGLPSPDQVKPTDEELDQAYEDGYQAAADGKTKGDAPVIRHELVTQWLRGFNDWYEQNSAGANAQSDEPKAA